MPRLVAELEAQYAESAKLEQAIRAKPEGLPLWRVSGEKILTLGDLDESLRSRHP